jgi:trk system potassium uptake protein TrkA
VELVKFRLPENSPLVGMSVREAAITLHSDVLFCTVEREDAAYIVNGDFVFAGKDIISLIASPKKAAAFFKKIAYRTHSVKDAMIAGGGQITRYLCEMLHEDGVAVKIIERRADVCDELTARYPYATVIHGEAGDQETLLEEGADSIGAFVALTNYDEENILLSLLAKRLGSGKLVTKITRFDFSNVVAHLDLDSIIYPKNVASDVIVRYVRAMKNTIGTGVRSHIMG